MRPRQLLRTPHRSRHQGELVPEELAALTHYDLAEVQQEFVTDTGTGRETTREIQLTVEGLTCAACAWLIERHLMTLRGLRYINVNTTTHRARIRGIRPSSL